MTKREKAVAVAKDVLAQLKKRNSKMKVANGCGYVDTRFPLLSNEGDLRDLLPDMLKQDCYVCARGAALISKARLFDEVPVKSIYAGGEIYVGQEDTTKLLASVFSKRTLDNIEAAFECDYILTDVPTKKTYGAILFGSKYKDPKKRLVAIMENVIANDGEFVVEPVTREQMVEALSDAKK